MHATAAKMANDAFAKDGNRNPRPIPRTGLHLGQLSPDDSQYADKPANGFWGL